MTYHSQFLSPIEIFESIVTEVVHERKHCSYLWFSHVTWADVGFNALKQDSIWQEGWGHSGPLSCEREYFSGDTREADLHPGVFRKEFWLFRVPGRLPVYVTLLKIVSRDRT